MDPNKALVYGMIPGLANVSQHNGWTGAYAWPGQGRQGVSGSKRMRGTRSAPLQGYITGREPQVSRSPGRLSFYAGKALSR